MAWDGDALAEQMERAAERQQELQDRIDRKNKVQQDSKENVRLESLRMSYARIKEQLETTTNPIRRAALERALCELNEDMKDPLV
jgi:hypothetical protein